MTQKKYKKKDLKKKKIAEKLLKQGKYNEFWEEIEKNIWVRKI